jgi:N-acetylneuraminic acid mutarotase
MRFSVDIPCFARSTRLALRSVPAAALLIVTAACQDSPAEPERLEPVEVSAPALAVASNSWLTRANMPGDARKNIVAASVTNAQNQTVLYVFGGRRVRADGRLGAQLRTVQAYNAATNSWSDKNPSPAPIEYSHGAEAIGGRIYIAGGKNGFYETLPYLWQYDPASDTWTRKRDLPVEGFGGVSGVIAGKLYVLARCLGSTSPCSNPDYEAPNDSRFFGAYDPTTDQWTPLALPPGGRDHQYGAAGVIGGKLYVAGGRHTNALDIYDPATNQWTSGASMGSNRGSAASATVAGKMYVIAGVRYDAAGSSGTSVATTSRYDPATNTWKNLAPAPRGGAGLAADRVVVGSQPRVDLVGGARPGNNLQYVP